MMSKVSVSRGRLAVVSLLLICAPHVAASVVGFEDLTLSPESAYFGADGAGGFTSGGAGFNNTYTDFGGGFFGWTGWSYANVTDSTTPGFANQFGVITGGGQASATYGLGFVSAPGATRITLPSGTSPTSLAVTNGTYPYYSMLDGDAFAKEFGGPTGNDPDYFRLTIEGFDGGGAGVGSVEFYLADFRFADNTQDYIVDTWTDVDLTSLAGATELAFSLDSTDVGSFGMNTPAYFAVDNLQLVPEPATLVMLTIGCAACVVRRSSRKRGRQA